MTFASTLPLTARLAHLTQLSAEEIAALAELQANPRKVPRHREIIAEGRTYDGLLVLIEGAAIRYRILPDGRRQIINIALPGDFIGFPGCFFEHALYSITSVVECLVAPVAFGRLLGLFERYPRLAATIFWSFSCETAIYAEHLIDVGRRSAIERIAHFLLELLTRFEAIGQAEAHSYHLPLTQELIGDALGLSVQYVNQTLRQLRGENLIRLDGPRVTILDYDGLVALADFQRSYLERFRIAELRAQNWSGASA
jgi:CRP-like cAMP-binding protein